MSLWYWVAFALLLGTAELFTGTAYLLWLSLSAFVTALISWLFPGLSLPVQMSIFALLSLASATLWFMRNKYLAEKSSESPLNQKAQSLIGRKLTLTENMHDYRGRMMIDGVLWRIKAKENYSAATEVEIKDVDATVLIVHATPKN